MIKIKGLFKVKYPKILVLLIAIILAYLIFRNPEVSLFVSHLGTLSYLGVFIAGVLFAFGFTAPFSVGFFINLNPEHVLLAAIIGGLGALVSDLIIFKFIKFSLKDEFNTLKKEKRIIQTRQLIEKFLGKRIKVYLMYAFAGILIASPLPDEVGVMILAGLTKIKVNVLIVLSFILNSLGILLILSL